jgi:hypothetical protein
MKSKAFVTLYLVLFFAVVSFAHNGVEHIMGTVKGISAESITVETAGANPTVVTILVLPSAKFLKDGAEVSFKEMKVGTRVVVNAKANADKLDAVSVVLGKQPAHGSTQAPAPHRVPVYDGYQQLGNYSWLEA